MSNSEHNVISDEEQFELRYHYFLVAVKKLELEAKSTCELNGYYNVAWEIVNDATIDGEEVLLQGKDKLSRTQLSAIKIFLQDLKKVPDSILVSATTEEENIKAMKHACWSPIRKNATQLISILEPATKKNKAFFQSN